MISGGHGHRVGYERLQDLDSDDVASNERDTFSYHHQSQSDLHEPLTKDFPHPPSFKD